MAQKLEFWPCKHTLGQIQHQPVCLEPVKQSSQVPPMFLVGAACHEDIIQVHKHGVEALADPVHQMLEGLCRIL